jgi:hypothetical protein
MPRIRREMREEVGMELKLLSATPGVDANRR